MKYKKYQFKSKTVDGRLVKTTVFMHENNIVVIERLILCTGNDLKEGFFYGGIPCYVYNDYILDVLQNVFYS